MYKTWPWSRGYAPGQLCKGHVFKSCPHQVLENFFIILNVLHTRELCVQNHYY